MRLLIAVLAFALVSADGVLAGDAATCTVDPSKRIDCGYAGIDETACRERGCCFGGSAGARGAPQCFFAGASVAVDTVHIVFACHLDVGFADTAPAIVNRYFDTHFPRAYAIGKALRDRGGREQLKFMTQSYLISLFLDCPSGMGLHCPNATALAHFHEAVANEWITWHAFPFNAELGTMDASLVTAAIEITHNLDRMLGRAPKQTLSQRDVPGMSKSVLPLLLNSNVSAVAVGVNTASTPPNVPRAFRWQNGPSTVLAFWHPKGYGGEDIVDAIRVPGFSQVLLPAWRGDNAGPPESVDEVLGVFARAKVDFPTAHTIQASTYDTFISALKANAPLEQLPLITQDIGDTWTFGVATDPRKVAKERAVQRLRTACLANTQCSMQDHAFYNFTRLLTKSGEHTDGLDVKTFLHDETNWSNVDFEHSRNLSNFQMMTDSWNRQRKWDYEFAVSALDSRSALAQDIAKEFSVIDSPTVPSTAGYVSVPLDRLMDKTFQCGALTLQLDPSTGALVRLSGPRNDSWASTAHPLAHFQYTSYSGDDFQRFWDAYLDVSPIPDWAKKDYGKPGCFNTVNPTHQDIPAQLQRVFVSPSNVPACSIVTESRVDDVAHRDYGAPQSLWTEFAQGDDDMSLTITLTLVNKTATRLPEGLFYTFAPTDIDSAVADRQGDWIAAGDNVFGGSVHMLGVQSRGVRFDRAHSSLTVAAVDAAIAVWGVPNAFPAPTNVLPDVKTYGASFVLAENIWGTNYPQWFPFNPDESQILSRFSVKLNE